jgi:hypothetical protein
MVVNLQHDAANLRQSDRIRANINAIAAQILSRPQIKPNQRKSRRFAFTRK